MAVDASRLVRELIAERDKLYSYIWSMVGDVHLAEDVFQELSLLVLEKEVDAEDGQQLRAWLRRAARFKALEALRTRNRGAMPLDEAVLEKLEECWARYDAMPDSDFNEALAMLRECMKLLTPNGRRVLLMHYAKGLRPREIARRLKSKVESVYQAISRAHQSLSQCVREKLAAKRRRDA